MQIPQSIIKKVGKFLGKENIRWFGHVKGLKGHVNTVLRLNYAKKHMPAHFINLREGMQIRNFMRGLPECKEWSFEDFQTGWVSVVEALVEQQAKQNQ